ncbi:MAG: DUF1028 domain-containing protein [Hyphomicrobiales bacterium]|nr:DUF1028 domain-containing protein [Hyphomicrobiales bacterium]
MTFSILGFCPRSGMLGMAVSSSSPAVAARCAHARARVGVVATQNITDPSLGPKGLDLLEAESDVEHALEHLKAQTPHIEYRQLVILDRNGKSAGFSGTKTLGTHALVLGRNGAAAGNLLQNIEVPSRMLACFEEKETLDLGDRLVNALMAGLSAGGEAGPVHSAGLLMVRDVPWPVADLRVDWHDEDPIGELAKLWKRYKPQMDDYVTRALDPDQAPSYGVPGEK